MGVWGADILEDDVAADVYADFMERFDSGMDSAAIRAELESDYADALEDDDDRPSFWLALAKAEWECGQLQPDVLEKVSEIVRTEEGLERWEDSEEGLLEERKNVLKTFLALLNQPNMTPHTLGEEAGEV